MRVVEDKHGHHVYWGEPDPDVMVDITLRELRNERERLTAAIDVLTKIIKDRHAGQ